VSYGWQLVTAVDDQNQIVGDLRVSGSRFVQLSAFGDRVAQSCTVVIRWWEGEWFADRSRGMPYIRELLKKGVREGTVRAVLRRELLRVEGVAEVQSMQIEIDRRTRRCTVRGLVVISTEGERVPVSALDLAQRRAG
jgi:hypothetical protein